MKHMKRNGNIFCVIALIGGLILASVMVFLVGSPTRREPAVKVSYNLLGYPGWAVVQEDGSAASVTLPTYVRADEKSITIRNTLPRALETGTYLAFESHNCYVEVKIDGDTLYRNLDVGQPTCSMWNFIQLDAVQSEGRINIQFSGSDAYDVGIIPEIYIGPYSEILMLASDSTKTNTQFGQMIIFFGIFVLLFSLASFSDSRYVKDFILLGLFIIVLGLSQTLQIVHPTGDSKLWIISQGLGISMFGLLPPFYCYYKIIRAEERVQKRYHIVFWISMGFFFLIFILRWFGSAVFWPSTRIFTYLVFEGIYGFCLYSTLSEEKEDSLRYRVLVSVSLVALMLGMGLEGFTHLSYTHFRAIHPMMSGALVFSLLHTIAVMLYVFDHAQEQVRMAEELSESQFRLMLNQLKPHFIRNSLATIRVITRHDPQKAYDMLYDFANYISYNIDSMRENKLTPFSEELKHIREYTNIEEEHLRHRLRMVYDSGPTDFLIPPLSVEPFVENAVKHGVWPKREGGTVWVSSGETDRAYIVTIKDNGVGFDPQNPPSPALRGHGIGMNYAVERIRTMVNGEVLVKSELGKGTIVTITIPKTETEAER